MTEAASSAAEKAAAKPPKKAAVPKNPHAAASKSAGVPVSRDPLVIRNTVRNLLIKKYHYTGNEADLIMSANKDLVDSMMIKPGVSPDKGFSPAHIAKALNALEDDNVYWAGKLQRIGGERVLLRRVQAEQLSKQLNSGQIDLSYADNFDILDRFQCDISEFTAILNSASKEVGIFGPKTDREVTTIGWDTLVGNQDGKGGDKVSRKKLRDIMENEVFVFAGQMSSDELQGALKLFAAKHFVIIPRDKMAEQARETLYRVSLRVIDTKFPALEPNSDPAKITERNALRLTLIANAKLYLYGSSKTKPSIRKLAGENADIPGNKGEPAKAFNYFEGYETAMLVQSYFRSTVLAKGGDDPSKAFYTAGLATLYAAGGLLAAAGDEIIYGHGINLGLFSIKWGDVDTSNNDVLTAFIGTIMDYGVGQSGVWTYGQDGTSLKVQLDSLKNKVEIAKIVKKVDSDPSRKLPETAVGMPKGKVV